MTRTYNEGLEAAAKVADNYGCAGYPKALEHIERARLSTAKDLSAFIRALKQEEAPETSDPRDALIKELMGALVAAQVAMSDGGIPSTPFVTDALSKINSALSKAKGVVDGS